MACSDVHAVSRSLVMLSEMGVPPQEAFARTFKSFCGGLTAESGIGFPQVEGEAAEWASRVRESLERGSPEPVGSSGSRSIPQRTTPRNDARRTQKATFASGQVADLPQSSAAQFPQFESMKWHLR